MKWHLDENVHHDVGYALRRLGFDVTIAQHVGLTGEPDEGELRFSTLHSRVLITNDRDFLRAAHFPPIHPGILYAGYLPQDVRTIVRSIVAYAAGTDEDDWPNRVHFPKRV